MGENLNFDILEPAFIFGAANLLFQNNEIAENLDHLFIDVERANHVKVRNFFEEVIPAFSLSDFKSHFRLTRRTFQSVLDDIGPLLNHHRTGPQAMGPEKQLCIALWTLANQEVYRSVADRFGVSKDTAWRCTMNVSQVLNNQAHNYIQWSSVQELIQVEHDFEEIAGFPGVVAAVDGCHIEISAPCNDANSYVNRKHFHSVLLQGTCDANRKFIDVYAGICGSVHDARLWRMSDICREIQNDPERYCPRETHIIGDSAYPVEYHLLPPFRDNGHLTRIQRNYNTIHSRTRVVIERTFGLLKGRFRRLKFLYLQHVENAPLIILACCVLHNICLDLQDEMNDIVEDGNEEIGNEGIGVQGVRNIAAADKRDIIAELLMEARRNRLQNAQRVINRLRNVRRRINRLQNVRKR